MSAKKRSGLKDKPGVNGGVKQHSGLVTSAADRARARELRTIRVEHIVKLMTAGQWQGIRSHRSLAKKWEASIHSVADYAREANSLIRCAVSGDLEVIRTEILLGIHRVRDVALKLTKPMLVAKETYEFVNTPDVGAALRSYELQAKMLGLLVEKRQELPASDAELTPEQHRAELAKLKAEIEQQLAAGEGGILQ